MRNTCIYLENIKGDPVEIPRNGTLHKQNVDVHVGYTHKKDGIFEEIDRTCYSVTVA